MFLPLYPRFPLTLFTHCIYHFMGWLGSAFSLCLYFHCPPLVFFWSWGFGLGSYALSNWFYARFWTGLGKNALRHVFLLTDVFIQYLSHGLGVETYNDTSINHGLLNLY